MLTPRRLFPALLAALAASTILGSAGCTTSSWESSYVGTRDDAAGKQLTRANTPVRIRVVTWDRVQRTLGELNTQANVSDIHPDDWTQAQKDEVKVKLLRGLQVTTDPARVEILGRSDFRTTDSVRPETDEGAAQLSTFARKIGADTVMYSSRPLGKADKIVREPVSVETINDPFLNRRDGDLPGWYSQRSFAWVPVRIQSEEIGFVAFFLRTR